MMTTISTADRLTLTVKEAGQALGVGRQTIYALLHAQELRHIKLGRKILIPRDALEEWLKKKS